MAQIFNQKSHAIPLVSVACITYNHEKFIGQAIESVLMQETDFPVEFVIGEDCSTDGTREIVKQYAEKFPSVIRALFPEKNLGMAKNYEAVRLACRGKYIAWLEGDDYWILPSKLQTQVDLMEANPHFSMCGTKTLLSICGLDGVEKERRILAPFKIQEEYGLDEFLLGYTMHTTSMLLRNGVVDFPSWLKDIVMLRDTCVFALHADKGPVGFINDVASCYRLHEGGIWTSKAASDQLHCNQIAIDLLDEHFDRRHHGLLMQREYGVLRQGIYDLRTKRMFGEARHLFWQSAGRLGGAMPMKILSLGCGIYGGFLCRDFLNKFTMHLAIRTRIRNLISGICRA
jgi:glycosyltransferase involved in cell wall biosynthesis